MSAVECAAAAVHAAAPTTVDNSDHASDSVSADQSKAITGPTCCVITIDAPSITSLLLCDGDGNVDHVLPADSDDIFSLETFGDIYQRRKAAGQHLVVAVVRTRDPLSTSLSTMATSYYDALPLLRLLFKVESGAAAHRYSRHRPSNPYNPLSNTPIVGEVKFYLLHPATESVDFTAEVPSPTSSSKSELSLTSMSALASLSPPQLGESLSLSSSDVLSSPSFTSDVAKPQSTVTGTLIGTDYNYAFSPEFRVRLNALASQPDPYLTHMHRLLEGPQKPAVVLEPMWTGIGNDTVAAMRARFSIDTDSTEDYREVIRVSFRQSLVMGTVLGVYCLAAVLRSANVFLTTFDDDKSPTSMAESGSLIVLLVPPLSFTFDALVSMLFRDKQKNHWLILKMCLYACFFTFEFVSFGSPRPLALTAFNALLPWVFLLYSALYFWRNTRSVRLD